MISLRFVLFNRNTQITSLNSVSSLSSTLSLSLSHTHTHTNTIQLLEWYGSADPLASALAICFLLIVYVYFGSIIKHDYSFVDRQW